MTLREATHRAVQMHDVSEAGRIVEHLRLRGLSHEGCAQFFERCAGTTLEQFEALMLEVDSAE